MAFITNKEGVDKHSLGNRVQKLISGSAELKFLVGFFYFSGWRELYKALKKNENVTIKLLVGLQVDHLLGKLVEVEVEEDGKSDREKIEQTLGSFSKALNDDSLDNEDFYEQVEFFVELLETGRLEIAKTRNPNHAKIYFFRYNQENNLQTDTSFITGSSNLTRSGFKGQEEFNIEILNSFPQEEVEKYFDDLWDDSIKITAMDAIRTELIKLIRNRSQAANVSPFEAYVMVLRTYLQMMDQKKIKPQIKELLEDQGYIEYSYQTDAVKQALTIIDEYQGAIISDVVGLGKSVIASLIAKSLGKRGMIICPPGLMGDERTKTSGWHKYTQDFKLYDWEVHSSGNLEKASEYLDDYGDDVEVVVIDEAHRFRNQDTEDYEYLNTICKGRIVLLLTATPFNNSPADIFSLLKLFIVPGKSRITLEDNLEGKFSHYESIFRRLSFISKNYNSTDPKKRERAENYYEKIIGGDLVDLSKVKARSSQLAAEIRNVLEPILIRRNRLDLKNDPVYKHEVDNLSNTENPNELFFELTREQSRFYDRVQDDYFSENGVFKGAIYQPYSYEQILDEDGLDKEGNKIQLQQRNLFGFMRRLLVKRFESSFGSFRQSIINFTAVHKAVLEFINKTDKYILDRDLIEKIYTKTDEEIEQALKDFAENLENENRPRHHKIYKVSEFAKKEDFISHIENDIALLEMVKIQVDNLNLAKDDPKANRVIEEVKNIINEEPVPGEPRRKVILFTEYVDTVKHLKPFFEKEFGNQLFVVDSNPSKKKAEELLDNFDASRKKSRQKDDHSILLTSDVLSEGQNLNRAGAIINYDIPWNPTRVIQRVGRINRIGEKVFENLRIYNFFPTEQGASIVKSREIAANKMFLIHSTLGEDVKIFDADEEPSPSELFNRVNQHPDEAEDMAPVTQIRLKYNEIQSTHPEVIERVSNLPYRVKTAKASENDELYVFRKKGISMFINKVSDTKADNPDSETIYSLIDILPNIECDKDEKQVSLSKKFWKNYEAVKSKKQDYSPGRSENSIEVSALNTLKAASSTFRTEFKDEVEFINVLIKDLINYRSLPKYTMRRIANVDFTNRGKAVNELKQAVKEIKQKFGSDYLDKLEARIGDTKSEVIIAIENIKAE